MKIFKNEYFWIALAFVFLLLASFIINPWVDSVLKDAGISQSPTAIDSFYD